MQHDTDLMEGQEFLAFRLGSEEYGLDILKVQEIRGYEAVTKIANSPEHVKGVVNLRGVIVPIIDLRIKFQLGSVNYGPLTVVIIVNVGGRVMGVVVDSVSDVIRLAHDQVKPAPGMGASVNTDYVTGIGSVDERMVILVNIDRLLDADNVSLIDKLAA